jgi:hypothetical protein
MSMVSHETMQLDHGAAELSTYTASERENEVRHRPGVRGHVESHFLKANSPDGQRAIWVKHTLLVPLVGEAVAEVWAIAFAEGGRRKVAEKASYPLAQAVLTRAPFGSTLPGSALHQGSARGQLESLRWQLQFAADGAPFLPFRTARMYTGRFPRSKSLTPVPDTRMFGEVQALGERWQLDGWRGAQGHNWGQSHAHAYAWLHVNALSREPGGPALEDTWLEALSGKVRLGPLVTPWLSVAGLRHQGRLFRFDGLSAMLSRKVAIDTRSYRFTLAQDGMTVSAEVSAHSEQLAGLRYEDPDGQSLSCLNSKLAHARLTLSHEGRSEVLHSAQAALELGTRRADHGIALLA